MKAINILFIIINILAVKTFAANEDEVISVKDLTGYIDLAVPDMPAFTALGVTPENVISPGSQHELALALLNGVDGNGNMQSGVALEASPYALTSGKELTLSEYKKSYWRRFLYNTRLSYATSGGKSDEDKADRQALGIRFSLFNNGDLRRSAKVSKCFESIPNIKDTETIDISHATTNESGDIAVMMNEDKTPQAVLDAAGKCSQEASKSLWNAASWDVGYSYFKSNVDEVKADGHAVWTSLSLPISEFGQVIFHAKSFDDMLTPDVNEDDVMDIKDGEVYAIRTKWGTNKANLIFEYSRSDINYSELDLRDDYKDYMIGTEFEIYSGIWVQLSYGKRDGSKAFGENEDYLSGQIRWAISESSLLK